MSFFYRGAWSGSEAREFLIHGPKTKRAVRCGRPSLRMTNRAPFGGKGRDQNKNANFHSAFRVAGQKILADDCSNDISEHDRSAEANRLRRSLGAPQAVRR